VSGTEPNQRLPVTDAWLIDDSARVVGNSYLGIASGLPVIHPRLRRLAIVILPKRLHCGSQTQPFRMGLSEIGSYGNSTSSE
jgi:hypothetical protein